MDEVGGRVPRTFFGSANGIFSEIDLYYKISTEFSYNAMGVYFRNLKSLNSESIN